MALWRCLGCSTLYAVGLSRCPRCTGTEFVEEGAQVAKITVHGGVSDVNDPETMPEPKAEPKKAVPRKAAAKTEGGESPSPGSSTSPSPEKLQTTPEKSASDALSPAPTTGSLSKSTPEAEGSGVPSTGGPRTSSATPAKKAPAKKVGGR